MFLTDQQVLQSTADMLKQDVSTLPAYWTNVVSEAHTAAYQEIEGRLIARGYTISQINQWDRGAEFERALTLFWALTNGGGLSGMYDDRFIKLFDRRAELSTIQVSVAGVYIGPGQDAPGGITVGSTSSGGDLFRWPDRWPDRCDGPGGMDRW